MSGTGGVKSFLGAERRAFGAFPDRTPSDLPGRGPKDGRGGVDSDIFHHVDTGSDPALIWRIRGSLITRKMFSGKDLPTSAEQKY